MQTEVLYIKSFYYEEEDYEERKGDFKGWSGEGLEPQVTLS